MARFFKAPKGIINHPGVKECTSAESEGCDDPGRKYFVVLHEGWHFSMKDGIDGKTEKYDETAARRMAFVDSVADFKWQEPEKYLDHPIWK